MRSTRRASGVLALTLALIVLVLAWPQAFGGSTSYVITHGVSMQPRIHQDDLVVVRARDSYAVGDVVAYQSEELGTVVLHRIVRLAGDRFVLKGDNNSWLDEERPTRAALVGAEVLHVPGGGEWLRRLLSAPALAGYAFLLVLGGRAATPSRRRRRKERLMSSRPRARASGPLALPPRLLAAAAACGLLAVAGALLSAVAWSSPTATSVRGPAEQASTMTFDYSAPVRPTAAYDGRSVTAPQPVFRRVVDRVDVGYRYSGPAGRVTVRLELSTSSGWVTTQQLGATSPLASGQRGHLPLDLASLQARADAAAAVTGLPASQITVAVVPEVEVADGSVFAPRFELAMDDLSLRPTGELATTAAARGGAVRARPASLELGSLRLGVVHARWTGSAAILSALALGAAVVVLARRAVRVPEAERVRRRYRSLVLPVLPVALAAGRPVVDVPDIASLAMLAERYGLLVLTWSRGGQDTYVVQDEGTTYRYRAPVQQPAGGPEPVEGSQVAGEHSQQPLPA